MRDRAAAAAAALGVRLVPSYQAMFAEGLDAVVVCSETSRHRPVVERNDHERQGGEQRAEERGDGIHRRALFVAGPD